MAKKQQIIDTIHKSQNTILDQINKVTSNEQVRKTTKMACEYGQRLATDIMKELQKQGKLTANETKKLIAQVNKKAELQKGKLQQSLRADSERLLKTTKNVIVNALALTKKYAVETVNNTNHKKKRSRKSR